MKTDAPNDQKGFLQLVEILDLNAVRPLHEALLALRGSDLVVDASAVRRIGGQCLQLLLSARQSWERDRLAFSVNAPSSDFVNTLRHMGLAPDLTPAKETVQ